jgi:hypothetical protein
MKMSLLEMVQDILSDMSGDYINSIGDTEESLQVAQIVKSTYHEMMTRREWPHLDKITTLQSYGDSEHPMFLLLPKNTRRVKWITYNQRTADNPKESYDFVKYLEPPEFVQFTNSRNADNENVTMFLTNTNVPLRIITDQPPQYWTSFDDEVVVMDAFVASLEDTLQGQNAQCEVATYADWYDSNDFIPPMPAHLFPALLSEAKSTAFLLIKEVANEKAEQQSRRQQKHLSSQGWRTAGGVSYPDYGRKRWRR